MAPLLETRHLRRSFGAVVAADDINVRIRRGETIGVIGANGAGKTTFVNLVTGYLQPSAGEILYQGQPIRGCAPREVTRLGICRSFQIPQLFLELTVLDNICIACSIARERRPVFLRPARTSALVADAMDILERFGLAGYASEQATTLAQGQRKILDIAMATASEPELLFLDEPTSGVSSDEKLPIMDTLLQAVTRRDTTVLFIEHDMEVIDHYAPRVLAFYEGTVLADGPTAEVLEDPRVRRHVVGGELHRHPEQAPC